MSISTVSATSPAFLDQLPNATQATTATHVPATTQAAPVAPADAAAQAATNPQPGQILHHHHHAGDDASVQATDVTSTGAGANILNTVA